MSFAMDFVLNITAEKLPDKYKNVIVKHSVNENGDPVLQIRSNISNIKECEEWVYLFSLNTSTQWLFRSSKPNGSAKLVCQKKYVCHHSAYHKRATNAENKNKKGISKSTSCPAQLTASVKVNTPHSRRNDPYTKRGLVGLINIRTRHNHPLQSPSVLKHLTPPEQVRAEFHNYFKMGMSISAACRYHENKLIFENDDEVNLDDARKNPTKRTVSNWFYVWRNASYGSKKGHDMKEKLDSKISTYAKEDISVRYVGVDDETVPFALAVVTPIMRRVHQSNFSKDVLFIDSTTCSDHENFSITFLLCASPCGAVPAGVIITKKQAPDAFISGFKLIQDILTETIGYSFDGQNYPSVVMTDNCNAQIEAAKAAWPNSTHLLCISHVLQNVLHWLQDGSHKIPKDCQKDLISTFQTILYSTDKTEAENAYESAMAIGNAFPRWQKYLSDQYNRKEKWCLAYRAGVTSQNTNYAEESIRLFKENILERIKAYNLVSLLEFVVTTMEQFYKSKLRDFYSSRDRSNHFCWQSAFKKADTRKENTDKQKMNENLLKMPCENTPVTIESRRTMAFVALGKEAMPSYDYFLPLHVNKLSETEKMNVDIRSKNDNLDSNTPQPNRSIECIFISEDEDNTNVISAESPKSNRAAQDKDVFPDVIAKLTKLHEKFSRIDPVRVQQGLQKFVARLEKIKTADQWISFLNSAAESIPSQPVCDKINLPPNASHLQPIRPKINNLPQTAIQLQPIPIRPKISNLPPTAIQLQPVRAQIINLPVNTIQLQPVFTKINLPPTAIQLQPVHTQINLPSSKIQLCQGIKSHRAVAVKRIGKTNPKRK